ncbi:hypothetical protein OIO90_004729 [Microbotryomycetes sp. JL221]|nr:hypothetical protein OIO90_004729 [Microbotryomycetes sp. JL221]
MGTTQEHKTIAEHIDKVPVNRARPALPPPPVSQQFHLGVPEQTSLQHQQARKPLPTPPDHTRVQATVSSMSAAPVPSKSDEKRAYAQALGIDIPAQTNALQDALQQSPDTTLPSYEDRDPDEREGLSKSSTPDSGSLSRQGDEERKRSADLEHTRDLEQQEAQRGLELDDEIQKGAGQTAGDTFEPRTPAGEPEDQNRFDWNCTLSKSGAEPQLCERLPPPLLSPAAFTGVDADNASKCDRIQFESSTREGEVQYGAGRMQSKRVNSNEKPALYGHSSFEYSGSASSSLSINGIGDGISQRETNNEASPWDASDIGPPRLPWLRALQTFSESDASSRHLQSPRTAVPQQTVKMGGISRLETIQDEASLAQLKRSMTMSRDFYGAGIGQALYEANDCFESMYIGGSSKRDSSWPLEPSKHHTRVQSQTGFDAIVGSRSATFTNAAPLPQGASTTMATSISRLDNPSVYSRSPPPLPPHPATLVRHVSAPLPLPAFHLPNTAPLVRALSVQVPYQVPIYYVDPGSGLPLPAPIPPPLPPASMTTYYHTPPHIQQRHQGGPLPVPARATPSPAPSQASYRSASSSSKKFGSNRGTFKRLFRSKSTIREAVSPQQGGNAPL